MIEVDHISEDGSPDLFGEFDVTALIAGALPGVDFAVDIRSSPIQLTAVG